MSATQGSDRKRRRLTVACNTCRARKIKCDDKQPTCTNCLKDGVNCITTDPRRPGQAVQRREAQHYDPNSVSPIRDSANISDFRNQSHAPTGDLQPAPGTFLVESSDCHYDLSDENRTPKPTSMSTNSLPALPRFMSGNSLQVLTQWLDLAFSRIGVPERFSSQYRLNPLASKPSKLLPFLSLSQPPPRLEFDVDRCADSFLSSVNMIYPIFDSASVYGILRDHAYTPSKESSHFRLSSSSAISSLLVATVETRIPGGDDRTTIDHFRVAYSLLSAVVAEASLRSTQALFLMCLVLRGYNEIEMAWHILTLATSIAQSLSMHRTFSVLRRDKLGEALSEEHVRTWWALYSLEKLLSLELERPSSIRDSECNQSMPKLQQSPPVFKCVIRLAQVHSQVNERCIKARSSEESQKLEYQTIIQEKIVNHGELDQMILGWVEDLPSELRPSNHLFCDPKLLPCVSFLAIQYHQTLVLLHRNTLLVNIQSARKEIDLFCSDKSYVHRLRNGRTICSNAARSIVSTLDNVHEHRAHSIMNTINAPLIAAYALAIHTLKYPSSGLARADLELQARAVQFVRQQQSVGEDYDNKLDELLNALQSRVAAVVGEASSSRSHQVTPTEQGVQIRGLSGNEQYTSNPFEVLSNQSAWDRYPNHVTSKFGISSDPASQALNQPMDLQKSDDLDFSVYGDETDGVGMDWDSLAVLFDLPFLRPDFPEH